MVLEVRYCEKNCSYYVVEIPDDYKNRGKKIKRLEIERLRLESKCQCIHNADARAQLDYTSMRIKKNLDELRETRRRSKKTIFVRCEDVPATLPTRPFHDVPKKVYKPTEAEYETIIEKLRLDAEIRREKMAVKACSM